MFKPIPSCFINHIFSAGQHFGSPHIIFLSIFLSEAKLWVMARSDCRLGTFIRTWRCQAHATGDEILKKSKHECLRRKWRSSRRGISSLEKMVTEKSSKEPHLRNQIYNMKLTALSIAAFAFFAQTMAEPLPLETPTVFSCPTKNFHCRSSMNILVNIIILTDLRRRRSMCKLIIPCEVSHSSCILILTVVGFFRK